MPGLQSALATSHETEGYSPNRHYKGTVQSSVQQDEQRVRTEDELGATGQLLTAREIRREKKGHKSGWWPRAIHTLATAKQSSPRTQSTIQC